VFEPIKSGLALNFCERKPPCCRELISSINFTFRRESCCGPTDRFIFCQLEQNRQEWVLSDLLTMFIATLLAGLAHAEIPYCLIANLCQLVI
jgi:hypothetical protein